MKFELEEFQATAAMSVARKLRRARETFRADRDLTAIGLTAPTGAGKTVIATAVLEELFLGTADHEGDPDLTVLWLTDDKKLNAQTAQKITQASERLDAHYIRILGETDEPTLEPGRIHFAHIQLFQKNSTLHAFRDGTPNDHRTHGIWDMIANTIRERGSDLLVVVDEAHRGTGTAKRERKTIVGTILDGGETNIGTQHPAAPVVLGISATPENFLEFMGKSAHALDRVSVPAGDVRASGLLKDRILIMPIDEDQRADHTMLGLAVDDLNSFAAAWADHHATNGGRKIDPILIVQVEPAVTEERLDAILSTLELADPSLTGYAVAHAFGEPSGAKTVGTRTVRYLSPEAIQDDSAVRVVLFKQALTTGWDCPRAEVLVSFQNRESYTEIAQLIGRLVRTPLAERANGVERLDEVCAYLPGYRLEHVAKVVEALTKEGESTDVPAVIVPVACLPAPGVPQAVFDMLGELQSFKRDSGVAPSRTAQMMKLATELQAAEVLPTARTLGRKAAVGALEAAVALREAEVDAKAADLLSLKVVVVDVDYGEELMRADSRRTAVVSQRDLEIYFKRAKQQLPDGAADWYLKQLCDDGLDDFDAMARVAAAGLLGLAEDVEKQATLTIRSWHSAKGGEVASKPRSVRAAIEPLWDLSARGMIPVRLAVPPERREATQRLVEGKPIPIARWRSHAFVDPADGLFPAHPGSTWEDAVLTAELDRPTLVTWYRNPPSGAHALAIPYPLGESYSLMHPDFLFVHDDEGELVIDIVDPHRHDDAAAGAKWSALAQHVAEYPEHLRRVLAVIRNAKGNLRGLDLRAERIADDLADADDQMRLEWIFDERGFDY